MEIRTEARKKKTTEKEGNENIKKIYEGEIN
jgi:hypothetical protein